MYLDITFIIITGIILLILSKTSYFKGILDGEIYHIPWWLLTTTLITIIILLSRISSDFMTLFLKISIYIFLSSFIFRILYKICHKIKYFNYQIFKTPLYIWFSIILTIIFIINLSINISISCK